MLAASEDSEGVEFIVDGTLVAAGTAEDPIVFTGQGAEGPAPPETRQTIA